MKHTFQRHRLAADVPSILRKFEHWWETFDLSKSEQTTNREQKLLDAFLRDKGFKPQSQFSIHKDDFGNFTLHQPVEPEHWNSIEYAIVDIVR